MYRVIAVINNVNEQWTLWVCQTFSTHSNPSTALMVKVSSSQTVCQRRLELLLGARDLLIGPWTLVHRLVIVTVWKLLSEYELQQQETAFSRYSLQGGSLGTGSQTSGLLVSNSPGIMIFSRTVLSLQQIACYPWYKPSLSNETRPSGHLSTDYLFRGKKGLYRSTIGSYRIVVTCLECLPG